MCYLKCFKISILNTKTNFQIFSGSIHLYFVIIAYSIQNIIVRSITVFQTSYFWQQRVLQKKVCYYNVTHCNSSSLYVRLKSSLLDTVSHIMYKYKFPIISYLLSKLWKYMTININLHRTVFLINIHRTLSHFGYKFISKYSTC